MKYLLIIVSFLACCLEIHAQTFPVQVNTQIIPPFSPYLADYTAPGAQKLMVNILLKDPILPEYQSKLRLTIEGVGITIRTKPSFIPQPLMLPGGGIPLLLYGEDMEEYFNPANLDFSGITRSQYEKGAKLPEGVYRFTIEVLDYNRGTTVSNKGTTVAWIILNDPPLLNFPRRDAKVNIIDPTNIVFSWTPRHTASPNAAFTTEYNFKLVEIWPLKRNPYDAILSQVPLLEVTTNSSQLIYGPAEPALIPGRMYAWQVQAKDEEGRDLFKNEGKSEVFVFQFGDALGAPENLRLQTANPTSFIVRWDQPVAGAGVITYRVRYRPAGDPNGPWYEETTEEQVGTVPSLQPDTEYQLQVRAEQGSLITDYSPIKTFKTKPAGANDFACNSDIQPPPAPANANPLFKLEVDDTIRAGGYEVLVRKVSGSNGTYTGEGLAIVPWFLYAKVKVTFDKINVNEQFWLTNGTIKSVWDANSKFLLKPATKPENQVTADVGATTVSNAETKTLIHVENGLIVSVAKNEDGDIVVETSSGETKVIPKGQSASIYDDVGTGYIVDKDGNIAPTTAEAAQAAYDKGQRTYNLQVQFAKGTGKFGVDEKKYDVLARYYQHLEGEDTFIPWKAVCQSQPDAIEATVEGTDIVLDKIQFKVDGLQVSPTTSSSNKITLSLFGKTEGTDGELVAYYQESDAATQKVIGKVNLTSYDKITKKVVIVPVNMDLPEELAASIVQEKLQEIYEQAVAYLDVKADNRINVTFNKVFDDGGSGLLSNYTADMKKVIAAYGTLEDQTYYLFLINDNTASGAAGGAIALGHMPPSKQAGFIFYANHKGQAALVMRTMAHELGHGAFHLRHTFKEFPGLSTNGENLMDYPAGDKLYKYQWDYVHDPQRVIPLFQGDEEGAMKYDCPMWFSGECEDVGRILDLIKNVSKKGGNIITKRPIDLSRKELVAENIELDGTEFKKIKVINLVEGDPIQYDPNDYEEYSQPYLDTEGKSDHQRGFVYRLKSGIAKQNDLFPPAPEPIIVKILLYDDEDEFIDKLEKLKKYLYGTAGQEPTSITSSKKRYVIFKGDANVRTKVLPYALVTPSVYLEKGKEVEIAKQLVEGEGARSLIRYKGESEEYCTSTSNLKEIIEIIDDQQYKLKTDLSSFIFPYSEEMNDEISASTVLSVTHECGPYKCIGIKEGDEIDELGWVKSEDLKKYIDNSNLGKDEFSQKFIEATSKAVSDITKDWKTNEAACNLCVRAALLNLTGDDVLFPTIGSSLTIRDKGEQVKGKVESGEGSAQGIVDDLMAGRLSDYFEEVEKNESETYAQFWQRLQGMVDNNKAVIIGTYDPGHVFMIVPGGLYETVDNTERETSGENISNTDINLGDRWGGSFAKRKYDYVLRIMDCGKGVKFSNGPMYGVMDAKAVTGGRTDRIVKYFRYKSN